MNRPCACFGCSSVRLETLAPVHPRASAAVAETFHRNPVSEPHLESSGMIASRQPRESLAGCSAPCFRSILFQRCHGCRVSWFPSPPEKWDLINAKRTAITSIAVHNNRTKRNACHAHQRVSSSRRGRDLRIRGLPEVFPFYRAFIQGTPGTDERWTEHAAQVGSTLSADRKNLVASQISSVISVVETGTCLYLLPGVEGSGIGRRKGAKWGRETFTRFWIIFVSMDAANCSVRFCFYLMYVYL